MEDSKEAWKQAGGRARLSELEERRNFGEQPTGWRGLGSRMGGGRTGFGPVKRRRGALLYLSGLYVPRYTGWESSNVRTSTSPRPVRRLDIATRNSLEGILLSLLLRSPLSYCSGCRSTIVTPVDGQSRGALSVGRGDYSYLSWLNDGLGWVLVVEGYRSFAVQARDLSTIFLARGWGRRWPKVS